MSEWVPVVIIVAIVACALYLIMKTQPRTKSTQPCVDGYAKHCFHQDTVRIPTDGCKVHTAVFRDRNVCCRCNHSVELDF